MRKSINFALNGVACLILLLNICLQDTVAILSNPLRIIYYEFGSNLGKHVPAQILMHLRSVEHLQVLPLVKRFTTKGNEDVNELNALILSLGNATLALKFVPINSTLKADSFRLRFLRTTHMGLSVLTSNGLPLDAVTHRNISFSKDAVHYGAVVGAYAALETLGFAFLHPLEPHVPQTLSILNVCIAANQSIEFAGYELSSCDLDRTEQPVWPERAFHIHTQHPLELTEVLQGHDIPQFGPHGPHCKQYSEHRIRKRQSLKRNDVYNQESDARVESKGAYCERWEDMVRDVNSFFEWAVANRLNKVEWLLLGNYKWGDEMSVRGQRLRLLTTLGHEYSLLIGADVPLGNVQQHGWNMVNVRQPFEEQVEELRKRVDWVLSAGFDFMTTESGLSEFTHPECALMLDLLNTFAIHVNVTWGREAGVKVHCSTGQVCEDFPDPRTGDPLNFNFLPFYAHKGLGVFPHTIQVYALDDPTGGAYGNRNFSYMEEYLVMEAKAGNRSVIFYPETSYWVNVDVDVPLFLPLYGQRRLRDLRRLRHRELSENFQMQGQMNFDSGWEWGYWISDFVTARASWDPVLDLGVTSSCSENTCTNSSVEHSDNSWLAFRRALIPLQRIFSHLVGSKVGERLVFLITELTKAQARLLINGEIMEDDGSGTGRLVPRPSPNLKKLSGIAYLMGGDTWVDLPHLLGLPTLQPAKVHLSEIDDPHRRDVIVLLQAMNEEFGNLNADFQNLLKDARTEIRKLEHELGAQDHACLCVLEEITDAVGLLALRAKQVHLLYASKEPTSSSFQVQRDPIFQNISVPPEFVASELQTRARAVIQEATEIVKRRESHYKVYWERVGAWRENPTVYRYGYLWAVHSLYYWWRDQGLSEEVSPQAQRSPCYLNRMDPSEIATGWGKASLQMLRNLYNKYSPFRMGYPLELINCLSPPAEEYEFPRNLYG